MARIDVEIQRARNLYTSERKEIPEIATLVGKSEATIYRWKDSDLEKGIDWDAQRSALQTTPLTAYKEMLNTAIQGIINLNETIKKDGRVPGKETYNLRLLVNSALALQKEVDMPGYLLLWGEKFTAFMQEENPELLEQLLPHLQKFGNIMLQEEKRKR